MGLDTHVAYSSFGESDCYLLAHRVVFRDLADFMNSP